MERKNKISVLLVRVAVFEFVIGILAGIIIGSYFDAGIFTLICWAASIISGIFTLGFAEIIELLDRIYDDLRNKSLHAAIRDITDQDIESAKY